MVIVAFGSVPKDSGTFTFYRNIRPALLEHNIDIRCVSTGKAQAELWEDEYADEGCVLLASSTRNIKKQAILFAEWCEQECVDIVMGINSDAILSSLPHLPEKIRVLSRCANAFDHGYKITMACVGRLAAIVATTPRLETDLVGSYGANISLLHLIPNGIAPGPFDFAAKSPRGKESVLRLGFLGRLEHSQKGVLHLPEIVHVLNTRNVKFRLCIVGKGKHRSILEQEMADEVVTGQVEFLGAIPPKEVPKFLAETDIFVFTSHFEGCPNALLEALMAGCVPVSWLIDGITDYIIEAGKTGFIHSPGGHEAFARSIEILDNDRDRLSLMSKAAAKTARKRFSQRMTAAAYAELFRSVMAEPPPEWSPVPWSEFKGDPNFQHSWREYIPEKVKHKINDCVKKLIK
ncbi:MAG: glycosyltransferase family 4 protein [Arenicellales bacterium]